MYSQNGLPAIGSQHSLATAVDHHQQQQHQQQQQLNFYMAAAASFAAANFSGCPSVTTSGGQFPSTSSSISIATSGGGPSTTANAAIPTKRERTKYSEEQLRYLERFFQQNKYPDGQVRERIAAEMHLKETNVQVWFKNRRAKARNETKYEQKWREEVKRERGVGSSNGSGGGGMGAVNTAAMKGVKREESVEDTEEEDQHQQQAGRKVAEGQQQKGAKEKAAKFLPPPALAMATAAPLVSQPIADGFCGGGQPSSLLLSSYDLHKGLVQVDPTAAAALYPMGGGWPSPGTTAAAIGGGGGGGLASAAEGGMGQLVQQMTGSTAGMQPFYSGWTQQAAAMGYAPAITFPFSYSASSPAGQMMFGQLANGYYSPAAGVTTAATNPPGPAGYYFPAQEQPSQSGID